MAGHERTPNGAWIRHANRPPVKRRQVCFRLPEDLLDQAERVAMDASTRPPFVNVTISDLMRRGLELAMAEIEPVERKKPCVFAQGASEGSKSKCLTCGAADDTECPNV